MPIARPLVRIATDRLPAGPWIYGRQVELPESAGAAPENGTLVEVEDASGRFVGHALYNAASDIRLRMLARGKKSELDQPRQFLERRLAAADRLRTKRLRLPETTDAYRIVHAEGDDLPGLIVDRLGSALVCEHHSLGFWRLRHDVEWVLGRLYPGFPVVHRVPAAARRAEGFEPEEEPRALPDIEVRENDIIVPVRPGYGHKTGYFCDQRDNRLLVGKLAAGADVLDLCCNSGGFALQAARLGARRVRAVDLDEQVLELAREAGSRNNLPVVFEHADAFDVLRAVQRERRRPGIIVLDPHKLVRNAAGLEEGLAKYGDMNALAIGAVAPGGLVATFSCSGKVDLAMFVGIVFQAARRAGRSLRLLQTLGAGPDHPQRPEFSRSRYLKGLLVCVD